MQRGHIDPYPHRQGLPSHLWRFTFYNTWGLLGLASTRGVPKAHQGRVKIGSRIARLWVRNVPQRVGLKTKRSAVSYFLTALF